MKTQKKFDHPYLQHHGGDLQTADDVRYFFIPMISAIGYGFHPDTRFADYVDSEGKPTFSARDAVRLDIMMERVFHVAEEEGFDVYELALSLLPPTFEQFVERKKRITDPKEIAAFFMSTCGDNSAFFTSTCGDNYELNITPAALYIYPTEYWIMEDEPGKFHFECENYEEAGDLQTLERKLYDAMWVDN